MNSLKFVFMLLLFVAAIALVVTLFKNPDENTKRERRKFIGENLPFLLAAMIQIGEMHKKYVPEDQSVAEDLAMASQLYRTILEKWPSKDLSLEELDAIVDLLSTALQCCSRARAGVMSQLTPEQRHEVETGYKDEGDK